MKFWTYGSKEKNYETIGEHSGSGYIYRIKLIFHQYNSLKVPMVRQES